MLTISAFQPKDLDQINPQLQQDGLEFNDYNKSFWVHPEVDKISITITNNKNEIIAIVGIFTVNPVTKVGECCAIIAKEVRPKDFFQGVTEVKRLIKQTLLECKYTRVQMFINSTFLNAHRLAALLGFAREGMCKNFGGANIHYDIYARIE